MCYKDEDKYGVCFDLPFILEPAFENANSYAYIEQMVDYLVLSFNYLVDLR